MQSGLAGTNDAALPAAVSAALLRGARLLEALRDWRRMTQTRLAAALDVPAKRLVR
ncbi:MAG: hypothetical protein OEL76_06155 [Siculibacillus sp.]|nr:hypothetical protein [Siculibacillus sp.]